MSHPLFLLADLGLGAALGQFEIDWHLLLIQTINFIVVTAVLYKFCFKPILQTMDERKNKIESGLQYAEKMRQEMAAFESARTTRIHSVKKEAEVILEDAKSKAQEWLAQERQQAQTAAQTILKNAELEANRQKEKILTDVKSEVGNMLVDVASALLIEHITAEQKQAFSAAAVQSLLNYNQHHE